MTTERRKVKKVLEPYDINLVPEANGLTNQSITMCYHNSLMQCLLSLPSIRKTLETTKDNMLASIFRELWSAYEKKQPTDEINCRMWNAIIETSKKRNDIVKFNRDQQDVNEGLMLFLSVFEKSIPELYNLFTHSYKQCIGCACCNHRKTIKQEDNTVINVNMTSHIEYKDKKGLEGYISHHTEILKEYTCESCGSKKDKISLSSITRLGDIIVVMFTEKYKEKKLIDFPQELRFPSDGGHLIYKLVAQCEHMGSQTGGHYNVKAVRKDGVFLINDSVVSKDELSPTANTYLIFYHFDKKSSTSVDLTV